MDRLPEIIEEPIPEVMPELSLEPEVKEIPVDIEAEMFKSFDDTVETFDDVVIDTKKEKKPKKKRATAKKDPVKELEKEQKKLEKLQLKESKRLEKIKEKEMLAELKAKEIEEQEYLKYKRFQMRLREETAVKAPKPPPSAPRPIPQKEPLRRPVERKNIKLEQWMNNLHPSLRKMYGYK